MTGRHALFGACVLAMIGSLVGIDALLGGDETPITTSEPKIAARQTEEPAANPRDENPPSHADPAKQARPPRAAAADEPELGREREHPPARVRRVQREARRGALAVARRFFAAFSRYEVLEDDVALDRQLRATATSQLARELLEAPPRLPPGMKPPAAARLVRTDFIAIAGAHGRVTEAQVVAYAKRAGEASTLGLELLRVGEAWRVSALTR
ncbi:MAG: hypothetical protein GEU88_17430 [Solirubrobacterales bacterium]|nr:hypothetical protein [Solirubrobacterales bacterium]